MLDEQWQQHIASTVAHWCEMAKESVREAAAEHARPSAVFKLRLSIDGNQWCALYGDNLQDGVAGFGDSPADAMWDFDRAFCAKLANSSLVTAAPELLDALKELRDWYEDFTGLPACAANAAIAKAEGRA